jgi:hypothetical protein
MKFRPVRAELFHADGRTDMTNLIIDFRKILLTCQKSNFTDQVLGVKFINNR